MSLAAVEAGLLEMLAADAGVKALLGDPPRVFDQAASRPAFPYLEVVRHESEPVGGADADAELHRVDLAIIAREGGRVEMKEALAALRTALNGEPPEMDGLRCVLLVPTFSDMTPARFGMWRCLVRVKAVVEPA